jgi:hypothetical protein
MTEPERTAMNATNGLLIMVTIILIIILLAAFLPGFDL